MKEYKIVIGKNTYTVQAENLTDAKKLTAYQLKMNGLGATLSISKLIKMAKEV